MSRPPRIELYDYSGVQRYFLTTCTHERNEHFRDASVVSLMLELVLKTAREQNFAAIAYCAMPDHLHLLVGGESDNADLQFFMKQAKQQSGYRFKQAHGTKLWQNGYHDHVLRGEERTEDVIYYIITNPVRSGLVANLLDYPFWGSALYSREELLVYIGYRG